jgi:hypothetical protein
MVCCSLHHHRRLLLRSLLRGQLPGYRHDLRDLPEAKGEDLGELLLIDFIQLFAHKLR